MAIFHKLIVVCAHVKYIYLATDNKQLTTRDARFVPCRQEICT